MRLYWSRWLVRYTTR